MTRSAGVGILVLLVSGCGSAKPKVEVRPSERLLLLDTRLKVRTAEVILSDRWREEATLQAVDLRPEAGGVQVARGDALFILRGLRIDAVEEIKVTYLADHEDLVVHARDVELFRQKRPYTMTKSKSQFVQRADQVAVVSIINSEPIIWPY
jgi:hypothetical protein